MNWVWITQQLEKLELLTFTQTCFSLCEKWFGVTMPISSCPLDETFYLSATRKVFEDGIFGHINQQNVTASVVKQIHRSSRPRILVLLGNTWKKIFPPYWDMRQIPWYSFVVGKPYLMPVAWIYRFFYCLVPQAQGCGGESDESLCPAGRDDSPGRVHYKLGTVDWHW